MKNHKLNRNCIKTIEKIPKKIDYTSHSNIPKTCLVSMVCVCVKGKSWIAWLVANTNKKTFQPLFWNLTLAKYNYVHF